MGSRLKGKKTAKKTERDRRALVKVLLYGAIGLAIIGLLWALWLSKTGLKKAADMKRDEPVGRRAAGP